MNFVQLSDSGFMISPIVMGMMRINQLSSSSLDTLLKQALDVGVTTFDHADIYGDYTCEKIFGHWSKRNKIQRNKIQLITKCGIKLISEKDKSTIVKHYDSSYHHIVDSVERSLNNLQTDYIDLLLIHRPDFLMDPKEVARAIHDLKSSGKILYFGLSNFTPSQIELLASELQNTIVTNQIEISLFHFKPFVDGNIDYLQLKNIQPMAWSPIGGSLRVLEFAEQIMCKTLCQKYSLDAGNLLLCWLMSHPFGIVPVIGSMNLERIKEIPNVISTKIERQDWYKMLAFQQGKDVA